MSLGWNARARRARNFCPPLSNFCPPLRASQGGGQERFRGGQISFCSYFWANLHFYCHAFPYLILFSIQKMFSNFPDFLIWSVFWKKNTTSLKKKTYTYICLKNRHNSWFFLFIKVDILSPGIYIYSGQSTKFFPNPSKNSSLFLRIFIQSSLKIFPIFQFLEIFSDPPPPHNTIHRLAFLCKP